MPSGTAPATPPTPAAPAPPPGQTFSDAAAVAALERILARNPKAAPRLHLPDVHPARIPRHVAIIMDGNGRWATARGLPRSAGHRAGAEAVRRVVQACGQVGVEVVTLYSFSLENWKRPRDEIDALMQLCLLYLATETAALAAEGIRLRVIGRREGLPDPVLAAIDAATAATSAGRAGTLCLAINYGSRAEITDAARSIAADAAAGRIRPADVDEALVASRLSTAGLPDPDLLIRTAGEQRLSNYLLWQVSYAELHVSPALWPDFGPPEIHAAIRDFASRTRRFGGLDDPAPR